MASPDQARPEATGEPALAHRGRTAANMGAVGRGKTVGLAVRVALGAGALGVLVLAGTMPAVAMPVGRQFAPGASPVVWNATTGNGTAERSPVTIDSAEVALGDELPDGAGLTAGQHYFYVALHPNYGFAGVRTPLVMPPTGAALATAGGTVTAQAAPPNLGDDAQWYFPVPADLSSATLHVDGFSKVVGDESGDFTPWTFGPATIDLVATSPVPASTPGSAPAPNGRPQVSGGVHKPVAVSTGSGTPMAVTLGAGAAGLLVVAAGGAGLVSLRRRRAFSRADREGRIVLSGPPALIAGATLPTGAVLPPDRQAIVVKLLGPLEVEGTTRAVTAGPLLEIIVFLALNPGRDFTSVQLRESIWGLGRQPITSNTFRKYMVQLRKAFGPGVVVTDVYRYQLTEAVVSDWDRFLAAQQAENELAGREQGLALVRGPVLHGSFDGRKNSPFSWATGAANDIEDEVTSVAVALALACLALHDPRRAATAVSRGLLCSEANLRLRKADLRVGAALGGQKEVGRRLEAGRGAMATFPKDVTELEEEARTLGWASVVPG